MDNPIPFHLLVHKFWEVHPILMSCAKFIFCYTKWPFHSENSTIFKRYTSPVNLCGQDMRWSCCRMPELEEGGCTELCDLCGKVWRQFVCLCILFLSWKRKAAPSILIFVERLGWMHIFVCLFVIFFERFAFSFSSWSYTWSWYFYDPTFWKIILSDTRYGARETHAFWSDTRTQTLRTISRVMR